MKWILGTDTRRTTTTPIHPSIQRRVREALDSEQKKKEAYIAEMKEQGYNLGAVGVSTRVSCPCADVWFWGRLTCVGGTI